MTTRRSYSDVEVKAGVFLAFCLALFVGMLLLYGKIPSLWRGRLNIRVAFASINTLRTEGAVLYNGIEVGRVKSMSILHLNQAALDKLRTLSKRDLDFLPLPETKRKELRLVEPYAFDAQCKAALLDKTMIEVALEVQEGAHRRYRMDDMVRVSSSMLGESAVEIISGSDRLLEPNTEVLLLGYSSDFFSNLSRSMGQVRDVLSAVTDVVSGDERLAFKRGIGRMDGILDGMNNLTGLAQKRAAPTSKKMAGLDESATRGMDALGKIFQRLQPDASRLFSRLEEARESVGKLAGEALKETERTLDDWKAKGEAILKDARYASSQSAPHVQEMQANLRVLSERLEGLSGRVDGMTYTAGQVLAQSQPELVRFVEGLKQGGQNLKSLRYIRERTAALIGRRDQGEHDFYTLLETYRAMERVARGPGAAAAALLDFRALLERLPPGEGPKLADAERARQRLQALRDAFNGVRDAGAECLYKPFVGSTSVLGLPPFPRKRAGWAVWPKR